MNIPEKSNSGNENTSKKKGALALAFGLGVVTGGVGGALFALNIDRDYCCVGQSCKCRYECRENETETGDC